MGENEPRRFKVRALGVRRNRVGARFPVCSGRYPFMRDPQRGT
jgi:hypothetical protein